MSEKIQLILFVLFILLVGSIVFELLFTSFELGIIALVKKLMKKIGLYGHVSHEADDE